MSANGHILVADVPSARGEASVVYDYSSASDPSPAVWTGSNTPAGSFGRILLRHPTIALAVDNSTGDVYLADTEHAVIDKFDQNGNLISTFGDTAPAANGQLAGVKTPAGSFSPPFGGAQATPPVFGIAVDQATGDLYVIDSGHQVIDVFNPAGEYLRQLNETPEELYGTGEVKKDRCDRDRR